MDPVRWIGSVLVLIDVLSIPLFLPLATAITTITTITTKQATPTPTPTATLLEEELPLPESLLVISVL